MSARSFFRQFRHKNLSAIAFFLVIFLQTCFLETAVAAQKKSRYKRYLSAVAIFRDEADYLKEWIEYHRLQGIEYFYLYNNLSTDHYASVLQEYVANGIVNLIDWPHEHNAVESWDQIQTACYRDAVVRCRNLTKWLLILDTDEFFVPIQHNSFAELLRDLEVKDPREQYASYTFFWVVFGTSGVERVPENRLMIEALTKNGGPHWLYKSVARPKYIDKEISPHWVRLKRGKHNKSCGLDLLQVNHYMYRDNHFLTTVKIPRREKIGTDSGSLLLWESSCNEENAYSDKIHRFIPELKARMGFKD